MRVTRIKGRPDVRRLPGGMIVTLQTARYLQDLHAGKRVANKNPQ